MEKKGWKITAITFIVLFVLLCGAYLPTSSTLGRVVIEYDECLNKCAYDDSCFSFQYDIYSGSCEVVNVSTIKNIVDEYIEEQSYFSPG